MKDDKGKAGEGRKESLVAGRERTHGDDVTVVTYGAMCRICEQAAELLEPLGHGHHGVFRIPAGGKRVG